jgi:hypothetical protein
MDAQLLDDLEMEFRKIG